MKNVAVILAGGTGNRFGLNIPKQFAKVAGKTIIEHTISRFQKHKRVDEICIVVHPDWIDKVESLIVKNRFTKVEKILRGGEERKDSSLSAIEAYSVEYSEVNMIFHDAVRPFVEDRIIDECLDRLETYNAIDVAIPAVDTIIEVDKNLIKNIPNRDNMMQGQTPQCFKLTTIKKAYKYASKDKDFKPTDDCGVVKKYLEDEKIYVVKGDIKNIKITHPQDIFIADKLFQLKSYNLQNRLNSDFYSEKLNNKVMMVFGGSYGIGKEIGEIAKKFGCKVYLFGRTITNTDISSISDIKRDFEYVYEIEKRVDFVVNTASILIKKPLINTEIDEVLKILNINYLGAVNIARESIKYLEETRGHLLNFTSSSYTRGRAFYSLYSSTKAAIVNFTQALAEELEDKSIKINCINPERTLTPMRVKNFGKEPEDTLLKAEDVAYVSLNTLLSDLTGQIVDVKIDRMRI